MESNLFPIAKEGWRYIISSIILFIIFYLFDFTLLMFLSFLSTIFFLFSFRNPEREPTLFSEGSVVSPIDGIVKGITEIENSIYCYKVEIESNCLDVGILRMPINSKVEYFFKQNGTRVSKNSKLFNDTNENTELILVDDKSNKLKIVHTLKNSFVPLYVNLFTGQTLHQIKRYGFMANGVTTIYLPSNFRLNININDELKASQTLLGYFS